MSICLCVCVSVIIQNNLFRRTWRPPVESRPPNFPKQWHNLFFFSSVFMILAEFFCKGQNKIVRKKLNGEVSRGRVCGSGWDNMISSQASHWSTSYLPSSLPPPQPPLPPPPQKIPPPQRRRNKKKKKRRRKKSCYLTNFNFRLKK